MSLRKMSREEFGRELNRHVRPAVPVDSLDLLRGREKELERSSTPYFKKGPISSFMETAASASLRLLRPLQPHTKK